MLKSVRRLGLALALAALPAVGLAASACHQDARTRALAHEARDFDAVQFGEIHGTEQAPALFLQTVCQIAADASRPPLVGVELSEGAVAAARAAIAAGGEGKAADQALARSPFWAFSRDGRSSRAYFRLLAGLVELERQGRIHLIGIDRRVTGSEAFGPTSADVLLARRANLARATKSAEPPVMLVYTGNGHAHFDGTPNSLADALAARGVRTLAVELGVAGGSAWVCSDGCGPLTMPSRSVCRFDLGPPARRDPFRSSSSHCLGIVTASPPRLP